MFRNNKLGGIAYLGAYAQLLSDERHDPAVNTNLLYELKMIYDGVMAPVDCAKDYYPNHTPMDICTEVLNHNINMIIEYICCHARIDIDDQNCQLFVTPGVEQALNNNVPNEAFASILTACAMTPFKLRTARVFVTHLLNKIHRNSAMVNYHNEVAEDHVVTLQDVFRNASRKIRMLRDLMVLLDADLTPEFLQCLQEIGTRLPVHSTAYEDLIKIPALGVAFFPMTYAGLNIREGLSSSAAVSELIKIGLCPYDRFRYVLDQMLPSHTSRQRTVVL